MGDNYCSIKQVPLLARHQLLVDEVELASIKHGKNSSQRHRAALKHQVSGQYARIFLNFSFGLSHVFTPIVMLEPIRSLEQAELAFQECRQIFNTTTSSYLNVKETQKVNYKAAMELYAGSNAALLQRRSQHLQNKKREQHRLVGLEVTSSLLAISHFITKHFFHTAAAKSVALVGGPVVGFIMAGMQFHKAKKSFQKAQDAKKNAHPSYLWLTRQEKLASALQQIELAKKNLKALSEEIQRQKVKLKRYKGYPLYSDAQSNCENAIISLTKEFHKSTLTLEKWTVKSQQHQAQLDALYRVMKDDYPATKNRNEKCLPELSDYFTAEQVIEFNKSFEAYKPISHDVDINSDRIIVKHLINKHQKRAKHNSTEAKLRIAIGVGLALIAASAIPGVGHGLAVIGLTITAVAGIYKFYLACKRWNQYDLLSSEQHIIDRKSAHTIEQFSPTSTLKNLINKLHRSGNPKESITLGNQRERKLLAIAYSMHRGLSIDEIKTTQEEQHRFQAFYDQCESMPAKQRERFFDSVEKRYRQDAFLCDTKFTLHKPSADEKRQYLASLSKKQRISALKQAVKKWQYEQRSVNRFFKAQPSRLSQSTTQPTPIHALATAA